MMIYIAELIGTIVGVAPTGLMYCRCALED